jgi:Na+/H+ antiporter NhaD/arsenite permease-like protein
MDTLTILIFVIVYLGMILGGLPGLALDRTGVALVGAIVLVAMGRVDVSQAWAALEPSTMMLLFGLMVVSAQFRLSGSYARLTRSLAEVRVSAPLFLGVAMAAAGGLSALLANDIVCLAMAPVLAEICSTRRYDPVPHLLGLACAANIGSAATLIGNPQNMLIGQVLDLSFFLYLLRVLPVVILGMGAAWGVIALVYRRRWDKDVCVPALSHPDFDGWGTVKGAFVLCVLVLGFVSGVGGREVWAIAGAGVLLMSRRRASRDMLALVDWQLLLLFAGLFVVNHALALSGATARALAWFAASGIDITQGGPLFVVVAVLSNLVSNVPAVMLLLPGINDPQAGILLALSSTLAGNLFVVGSIANIIVLDQAVRQDIRISWKQHAVVGVPVTLVTMAIGWFGVAIL